MRVGADTPKQLASATDTTALAVSIHHPGRDVRPSDAYEGHRSRTRGRTSAQTGAPADRPRSYSGLINLHNQALEACGLGFVICSLRHTFAMRFWRSTKAVVTLAMVLGHADLKTVMRYVHQDEEDSRVAMRLLEESRSRAQEVVH